MLKNVKGLLNKLLTILLIIPGYIKSYIEFGRKNNNAK